MSAAGLGLIGDVGATNARFALVRPDGITTAARTYVLNDYASLTDLIDAYLAQESARPEQAVLAVASPITGDHVAFTNHPWTFSIEAVRKSFGLKRLRVINDLAANALAIPHLADDDRLQIGPGCPVAGAPVGVIGPGTGLGVSALMPVPGGWAPIEGEGGHVTMAPFDAQEGAVLEVMRRRYDHVSAERVLSGSGLVNLYGVICELAAAPAAPLTAPQITDPRTWEEDPRARDATAMFCAMLGTVAGNLALTLGTRGGVYIAGGIVPKLGAAFTELGFRRRFEAKGRLQSVSRRDPYLCDRAPAVRSGGSRGTAGALGHGRSKILNDVHLIGDQTLGILSPAQLRSGHEQCRRACSHSISKSVFDRMTGRKAGDHGAQETVSRAHDTDGNDWSGLSAQDLIFRHQQRPLLSERERNHRGRPAFYEAAAGRDLLVLALQPGCSQLSEFPQARFHNVYASVQRGLQRRSRAVENKPGAGLPRRLSYAGVEVRRNAGRKAPTGNHETRRPRLRHMRRKHIEVGAPFLIAEPGPRHNETVGLPRHRLENSEIFPRLFRDGDGKTGDRFLLQETAEQLAQRPAHGVDRAYVGAESLRHPGHIDAAASRIAPRGAAPHLVERDQLLDGSRSIDRRIDGQGDDVYHLVPASTKTAFELRRHHPR